MLDELFGIVVKLFLVDFGDVYFLFFLIIVFAVVVSFVAVQVLFLCACWKTNLKNKSGVSPCCS